MQMLYVYAYVCLQEANYSHNDIEVIGDLSHHTSLTKLILDRILIMSIHYHVQIKVRIQI